MISSINIVAATVAVNKNLVAVGWVSVDDINGGTSFIVVHRDDFGSVEDRSDRFSNVVIDVVSVSSVESRVV